MRATDLDLRDCSSSTPRAGIIRFAGQRALLLDAVAHGAAAPGADRHARARPRPARCSRGSATPTAGAPPRRSSTASRGTAKRSGSRPAAGCTRCRAWCGSSRPPGIRRTGAEADRVRDLARLLRGRAAPAAPRPRRRAGVLDAHRLRQRLPLARPRPRDLLHGGALPRQGRRRLPRGRPPDRGVGRGLRRSPAVLREGLPGCRARRR